MKVARWTVPVFLLAAGIAAGQAPGRRATTIETIREYPGFFHGQPVLVRGTIEEGGGRAVVVSDDDRMPAFLADGVRGSGELELRATVFDIGRMGADDPRLVGKDLQTLIGLDPDAPWPRPGEIVVLNVTSALPAAPLATPTLRAIALAPWRFLDQRVTIRGQFRGRNLFGDLPQAPPGAGGRREFVLRSADAAIWITGREPRGRGFFFDINSRLDSQRWLEVTGVVKAERGLVWIVAESLAETSPQAEEAPQETVEVAPPIPPEVLFSVPTDGETDVALDTTVRIQFSRDIDPETLPGRVRVSYSAQESAERGEPQPPAIGARLNYREPNRVLEIRFDSPLQRFRTVTVELLEGIRGTDGAPLKPWTLTFTLGG